MIRYVAIALAVGVAAGALACECEKGTLEQAGEKVVVVVDDITHPGEGPLEEAGRKLGETVDEAKEDIAN